MTNRGTLVMLWPFYPKTWMHRVRALEEKNLQKEEIWDAVVVEATEKRRRKKKTRSWERVPFHQKKCPSQEQRTIRPSESQGEAVKTDLN